MKKTVIVVCTAAALMLSGCTQSNIVSGGPAEPVFETQQGIVLDWTQIGDDLDEQFVGNDEFPMGASVNYNVDPDTKTMDLTLMVQEGTTPEAAVKYANAVVRGVNDEAAVQDFSYKESSNDSYGGFFDAYTLNLIVMPDGMMASPSVWLVEMTIPAGSNEKIVPIEGAKAMETTAEEEEEDGLEDTEETENESSAQ